MAEMEKAVKPQQQSCQQPVGYVEIEAESNVSRAKRSDGVEVVTMPVNWPFGTSKCAKTMVSRVRTC